MSRANVTGGCDRNRKTALNPARTGIVLRMCDTSVEYSGARPNLRSGSIRQSAIATACIDPVLLDQEVRPAESHVVLRTVGRWFGGAERPRAFVGVFIAFAVVPGIQVQVGGGLFQFVRNH